MPAAPPIPDLSSAERLLLAAILDPTRPAADLDPCAVAALLKKPLARDAIDASRALDNLRLQQQIAATASRAVQVLAAILDNSKDPIELRRAATSITRLVGQAFSLPPAGGRTSSPPRSPPFFPAHPSPRAPHPAPDPPSRPPPPRVASSQPQAAPHSPIPGRRTTEAPPATRPPEVQRPSATRREPSFPSRTQPHVLRTLLSFLPLALAACAGSDKSSRDVSPPPLVTPASEASSAPEFQIALTGSSPASSASFTFTGDHLTISSTDNELDRRLAAERQHRLRSLIAGIDLNRLTPSKAPSGSDSLSVSITITKDGKATTHRFAPDVMPRGLEPLVDYIFLELMLNITPPVRAPPAPDSS